MARHRDDDFDMDDDSRDGNYGHSSRRYGKTSKFDTTSLSESGQWFGIKLSPSLAEKADLFYSTALTYLSEYGERWASKRFGPAAGNLAAYGIIFGKQGADVGRNLYDSASMLNDLRLATRPLAKMGNAASTAPLSGNNEVIANARGKVNGIFWQRILKTVASTIQAAPALINKISKHAKDQHEKELLGEFEKAKGNPEKQADLLEKELTVGSSKIGFNSSEMEAAAENLITRRRKAYEAKFKDFQKSKEAKEVEKELDELLKLTVDNFEDHLKQLERYGFGTQRLINAKDKLDPDKKTAIDAFGKAIKDQKKRVLEKLQKKKFVQQHGAFDHEWQEAYTFGDSYHSRNRELPPTHKQEIEKQVSKLRESQQKTRKEEESGSKDHDDKINEMFKLGSGLGAGIVSEIVAKAISSKALEEYKKPIALDRILHLRRSLEEVKGEPPENVPPVPGSGDRDMSYVRYVHEVFQQHQKDCNRPEIGGRFVDNFEKAHWNDAAILHMPDDKLNAYEFAVKTIAQRIKTGRMDAIALIDLVGDKQKKIVHNDGRGFGPGRTDDDEAAKKSIAALIDEKTAVLHAGQKNTDEEINEKLGNFIFSVQDMKNALISKDLDPQQRAFIFTLFSDVVGSDEKLCTRLGISNQHCQQLRKESKEHFSGLLDGAVGVLADLVENEPEKMEKHLKLTEQQKELILEVAGRAAKQGKAAGDVVENAKERETIETVVADGVMALSKAPQEPGEDGKPQGFWQKVVAATRKPREPKEKADSHEEDRANPKRKSHARRHPREDMDDSFHPDRMDAEDFPGQEDAHPSHAERLGGHKGKHKFNPVDHLSDKPRHDESGIRGI